MAKIATIATSCQTCPFFTRNGQGPVCGKLEQLLSYNDLSANQIPMWCPLPDHPSAEVEAIKRDVLDRRTVRDAERYRLLRDRSFTWSRDGATANGPYGISASAWGHWPTTDHEWDIAIDALDYDTKDNT